MRLNLFFNPSWRSEGQINIDMKVREEQRSSLQQMIDGKEEAPDDETLKRRLLHG